MEHGLEGKVAVVTGGIGDIGQATAAALRACGATAVRLDTAAADNLASDGPQLRCDVTDEAAVSAAFARVAEAFGGVDILVNNAGIAVRRPALELSAADWGKVLGVNLTGAFFCAREAARLMIPRGGGAVVNVASIMALSGGLHPNIAYHASKGGLVSLTRALAVEWAPRGIRVNAVAPTFVETALTRHLLSYPAVKERIFSLTPMRRYATPEEVAAAIVFLSGQGAAMTTGHVLAVDGGFLAV